MNNAQLNELKQRYVANGAASPTTQFADRAENALGTATASSISPAASGCSTSDIAIPRWSRR